MNTTLILGAGASMPYGFPSGNDLREYILKYFPSKLTDVTILRKSAGDMICKKFNDSGLTIDKFTQIHSQHSTNAEDVVNFAKLSITDCLTQKEKESQFNENCLLKGQDWYRAFIQNIFGKIRTYDEFINYCKNLTVVTFNYDRSFEYYLLKQMDAVFTEMSSREFQNKQLPIEVIHVYGSLGDFNQLEYRTIMVPSKGYSGFYNLIGDMNRTDQTEKIYTKILDSDQLFFLGFSYLKDNMEALGLNDKHKFHWELRDNPKGGKINIKEIRAKVFGTALGFSDEKIDILNSEYFFGNAILKPIDCKTMIDNYF